MIKSVNPFNDPEIKKQVLQEEGLEVPEIIEDDGDLIKEMLASAPTLPKSAKNVILDASAIAKTEKEQKAAEFNLALNSIITKYNEEYGTDIHIDFTNMSNTLVAVSDPETRRTLDLYVSEIFKATRPIFLMHILNRLTLCVDYVLDPKRMLDSNQLSIADQFVVIEKLLQYCGTINDLIEEATIKDSDSILQKMADDKNDEALSNDSSKDKIDAFLEMFKKEQGIE